MIELLPFQREDVQNIRWRFRGRCLLALDMGLGKTIVALRAAIENPDGLPAIVVCPAVVKYHWQREAEGEGLQVLVLEGRTPFNRTTKADVIVVNYDILWNQIDWLKKLKPKTIIVDECHRISNPKTKRTKAVRLLCRSVPSVLALSGTPLVNRPIELFPILQVLDSVAFSSRLKFAHRFCDPKWTPWGWKYQGASNTEELHQLLGSHMIRRRKRDVLKELPEKMRSVVPLPLERPEEYQRASDDFLNWLRENRPSKLAKAMRAQALVRMNGLLQLAARLKLRSVVEWINEALRQDDDKLVVFAVHKKMVSALRRRCEARSVVVDGSITGRARQAAVDAFQSDPGLRLLIGNIQAAGVGITLTAASTVVFAEMAWRPGDHVQAEDRCHRIGTTRTVWAHYLVAHGTIEEEMCKLIQAKQRVLSAVLDGGPSPGDLDVFDQLIRIMGRGMGVRP